MLLDPPHRVRVVMRLSALRAIKAANLAVGTWMLRQAASLALAAEAGRHGGPL